MLVKAFASASPLTSDFGLWSTNPPPCVALKVVLTLPEALLGGGRHASFLGKDDLNAEKIHESQTIKSSQIKHLVLTILKYHL